MWTLPNILSVMRIGLLPFMIVLFMLSTDWEWAAWACLVLYVIGALTDFLDGWIARRFNMVSEFGAFIDPLTDKIFVVTVMLMLVAIDRIENYWVLAVVIILVREFIVSGIREYLGPKGIKVPVTNLAKWKTTSQMAALGVLIIAPYIAFGFWIGHGLLIIASTLTVVTGWVYFKKGMETVKALSASE
ncbi:MAG: CDP-diacylglycerol--glycerol-3-phosphate 3-phosphatidyltransferase [Micavibrio sp.]|nr:CDP-diacylglycerol--glycerol-3-phosphate 3-phosphatidyltransferase [Micavibrio sp.]